MRRTLILIFLLSFSYHLVPRWMRRTLSEVNRTLAKAQRAPVDPTAVPGRYDGGGGGDSDFGGGDRGGGGDCGHYDSFGAGGGDRGDGGGCGDQNRAEVPPGSLLLPLLVLVLFLLVSAVIIAFKV